MWAASSIYIHMGVAGGKIGRVQDSFAEGWKVESQPSPTNDFKRKLILVVIYPGALHY